MDGRAMPRYPVFVPSKGRAARPLTVQFLKRDGVPFRLVVEREEVDAYVPLLDGAAPGSGLLVLPESGGGLIYSRNWIKELATVEGHARHWQLDDNIESVWRLAGGRRLRCRAGVGLRACEDFADRYENVAVAGLNYVMFACAPGLPPFHLNVHVYSCSLVLNALPHRWRLRHNDDTDLCLQVLADGWCTVLLNAFLVQKIRTMVVPGGNTDDLYRGDGRLVMARSLQREWPGVVKTARRYGRPQHVVRGAWRGLDTPLRPRPRSEWPGVDYDLELREVER